MKHLHSLLQAGKISALVFATWLLSSGLLFAKDGEKTESGGGGSWVLSYFLVLLGIVLGMFVVCRTSTRRDRVRPEAYAEGKISHVKEEKK